MRILIRLIGIILVIVGIVGLISGNEPLFDDRINVDIVEDFIHIITGIILLAAARIGVTAVGFLYLIVGILGAITPTLGGAIPHGYSSTDNMIHIVAGLLLIIAAPLVFRSAATSA